MAFRLKETMTAKRREWLEKLLKGPARRTSKVGCECMRLGWTEWVPTEGIPKDEPITDAGREALSRSNAKVSGRPHHETEKE